MMTSTEVCRLYGFSRQRLSKLAKDRGITPAKPGARGIQSQWAPAQVRKLKPGCRPPRGGRGEK